MPRTRGAKLKIISSGNFRCGAAGWSLQLQIRHTRSHFVHELFAWVRLRIAVFGIALQKVRMAFHLPVLHVSDQVSDRIFLCQKTHKSRVSFYLRLCERELAAIADIFNSDCDVI